MRYLSTEPSLDPPEAPELFFKCDECGEVISDADCIVMEGDICLERDCLSNSGGDRDFRKAGVYRPYEQPERDYDDN